MAKLPAGVKIIKLALVGGETLLGRELQEVLESRGINAAITGYSSSGEGNFGEQEGEAVYVEPLDARAIQSAQAILIAGSKEGAFKAYDLARDASARPILIDCTGNLENQPEARIIAPLLEEPNPRSSWIFVIAHPAADALALTLTKLNRYRPIQRAVAHIFEPASEQGKRGVSELHQQTTSLLAFKPLDKAVFDAQLSFNLLARFGEEAPTKLSKAEERIESHLAKLLKRDETGSSVPMPSLRLIQAPVFHGYSISLWVEFAAGAEAVELGEALACAQIEVRAPHEEPPNNVGAASQSGLIAGDIRLDRNNPRAAWFWLVADNLRLTADAVADLVNAWGTEEK